MKLFKRIALFLASVPLLVSCATQSIAGTYGFQLGKDTGTHFGMFLSLTNDPFIPEQGDDTPYEEGLKNFTFLLSVNMSTDEGDAETQSAIESILDYFKDEDTGDAVIPGYYKLTDETNPKGEKRIKLGISFKYIADKIFEVGKEETGKDLDTSVLNVLNNAAIIQNILCATYKNETVNVYIPVSIDDLYYQLYWSGTDVQIIFNADAEEITEMIKIQIVDLGEEKHHAFGTKPTKEDVEEINKTFKEDHKDCVWPFSDLYNEYRAFHQIALGLSKR